MARYHGRISGPLLDRIDLQIQVPAQPAETLLDTRNTGMNSAQARKRVIAAHQRQLERQGCSNAHLQNSVLEEHCRLDDDSRNLLLNAMNKLGLSARAYHRILRVARTIADLEGEQDIRLPHVTEAIGYRRMDRGG